MPCNCPKCRAKRLEENRRQNAAFVAHAEKWRVINARIAQGVSLYTALTQYNAMCQG